MTDADLVAKKLAFIETCLRELRELGRIALDLASLWTSHRSGPRIALDLKERRFVEHTLQICIQAALYVASRIASDERLGEPEANAALFDLLVPAGWLSRETAGFLRLVVGFRNVLVHGYTTVDLQVVRAMLEQRLGDIEQFVSEVRAHLSAK